MTTADKSNNEKPVKIKMVSLTVARDLLDLGESTHEACVKKKTLPPPMPYNARSIGYPQHELDQLIEACDKGASIDEMQALVKRIIDGRTKAKNFKRFAV